MHKCIPYAKIIVLRFVEPWWFMNLSERINPFPTHTLEHFPLGELIKFQFAALSKIKILSMLRQPIREPESPDSKPGCGSAGSVPQPVDGTGGADRPRGGWRGHRPPSGRGQPALPPASGRPGRIPPGTYGWCAIFPHTARTP